MHLFFFAQLRSRPSTPPMEGSSRSDRGSGDVGEKLGKNDGENKNKNGDVGTGSSKESKMDSNDLKDTSSDATSKGVNSETNEVIKREEGREEGAEDEGDGAAEEEEGDDVPAPLLHPLQYTWTMWYDGPSTGKVLLCILSNTFLHVPYVREKNCKSVMGRALPCIVLIETYIFFSTPLQPGRPQDQFVNSIKQIYTFSTLEAFWSMYNNVVKPQGIRFQSAVGTRSISYSEDI